MSLLPSQCGSVKFGAKALFLLTGFGFGALSAAVVGMSPEQVVAGRFVTALEQAAPATQGGALVQVAGTEDFWLKAAQRGASAIEPAAWSQHAQAQPLAFTVGDKVTVTRAGTERTFKVVAVSAPFKDGEALAVRVTAEDEGEAKTEAKSEPVVFTVPLPPKAETGKPRAS